MLIRGKRGTLNMEPPVDAGPAVEMATQGDHRLVGKVQADVTIEATIVIF